jgi:hypothetical protein
MTPPAEDTTPPRGSDLPGLAEAVMLGIATATLYMIAAASQLGYQDQFGFTFLSVNVDSIAAVVQYFILPLVSGTIVAGLLALVTLHGRRISREANVSTAIERLLLFLPLTFLATFTLITEHPAWMYLARNTFIVLAAFVAASPQVIGPVMRWVRAEPSYFVAIRRPLLWGQAILGAVLLIFFSYDFGKANALQIGEVDICLLGDDDPGDRIVVQQTAEVFVCARVDWATKQVFADFTYARLDEDRNIGVRRVAFRPSAIGVRTPLENAPRSRR